MILCTLNHIHLAFGERVIFKDEKIIIKDSDRIGLLGLNGQGKSSLLKIITGEVVPDTVVPPFNFDKCEDFSVFYVPQDIPSSFDTSLGIQDLFYHFYPELKKLHSENKFEEIERIGGWRLIESFESYLKYFGITDQGQSISELSGGQVKKIILSIGFSNPSRLVLWDEPTNHLDIASIEMFEDELRNQNKAFILVTHDRYLLSKVCNQIYQIDRGEVKNFSGSYSEYLEHLQESEELRVKSLQKIQNSLKRETEWMRQGIKARRTRSKKRVENYHQLLKNVQSIKDRAKRKIDLDITASKRKTKKILSLKEASFSYDNSHQIFNDFDIEVFKGDKIGLIGDNGIGKTTLIKCLTGDLNVTLGEQFRADDLNVQHFKQMKDEWPDDVTPVEILGEGTDYVTLPSGHRMHVAGYFQKFLFHQSQLNRPVSTFSGGEKTRLQLAYHLRSAGDVWIFDEPTNDLDLETINLLEETLTNFKGTVILISHDRSFLSNVTNKTILMTSKNLEFFEGGYSQAEEFIEASNIERRLTIEMHAEDEQASETTASEPEQAIEISEKPKPSFKDKQQYEEALKLKTELEEKIEQADALIIKLSETSPTEETTQKIIQLSEKKDEWELELLSTYEIIEEFELNYIS